METTPLNSALSFVLAALLLSVFAAVLATVLYWLLGNKVGKVDAINVSDEDGNTLPGIPFYTKRSRFLHETTYLETLVNLSIRASLITYDDEGKRIGTDVLHASSKRVSLTNSIDDKITALHVDLSEAQQLQDPANQLLKWGEIKLVFESLPPYVGAMPSGSLPVIGNVVREEPFVDYQSRYFQNATQPIVGSANVTIELGADGTLSKTNVQIEDSTISKLLDTFPTSKLFEAEAPEAKEQPATEGYVLAAVDIPGVQRGYEFSLDVAYSYVYHVLFKDVADRSYKPPIDLSSKSSWYRREFAGSTDPEKTGKSVQQPASKAGEE